MTLTSAAALFALVISLFGDVQAGARPALTVVEIMPGIGIHLAAEPLGVLFATVSSLLWIVTSVYSIGYMRANAERHQTRYYAYFAIALGCSAGIAFAADIFTLFIFYEGLTLSRWGPFRYGPMPNAISRKPSAPIARRSRSGARARCRNSSKRPAFASISPPNRCDR